MATKRIRSALPMYASALIWIVFGLIWPLYTGGRIVICALLSVGAYFLAGRFFKGRLVEVEVAPDTGDAALDQQITDGRAAIHALRAANDAIPSPALSALLDRMERAGMRIFDEIERNASKAGQVRKFMNYYLPTSVKLLDHYRVLMETGGAGGHIQKSMDSIEASLTMIASAFEKQLDNLYERDALDITTDIQVLETMLAAEGLSEAGMRPEADGARPLQ